MSFVVVCSNSSAPEPREVSVLVSAADEAQSRGLRANEWLAAVLSPVGGKGGGSPKYSEGKVSPGGSAAVDEIAEAARKFAAEALASK